MKTDVTIDDRSISVSLTERAAKALAVLTVPLQAEMELYFSCLIRKRVLFYEHNASQAAGIYPVNKTLAISFRPVMTKACQIDDLGKEKPPLTDFPIDEPMRFLPHWLKIDRVDGEWVGEFGYT